MRRAIGASGAQVGRRGRICGETLVAFQEGGRPPQRVLRV